MWQIYTIQTRHFFKQREIYGLNNGERSIELRCKKGEGRGEERIGEDIVTKLRMVFIYKHPSELIVYLADVRF